MISSQRLIVLAFVVTSALFAGCGGGGGGGTSGPPAPVTAPTAVPPLAKTSTAIVMNKPWTATAITVTAGEQLRITASGTFNRETGSCNGTCTSTPSGSPWATCKDHPPAFTAPGLACWSLIGKIGAAGTPFEIGSSLQFTTATAGLLYYGVNDNFYPDDSGTWTVTAVGV